MVRKNVFGIFSIVSLLILFSVSCNKTETNKTLVTFYVGNATIQSANSAQRPIQIKDEVKDGDIIETGDKSYIIIQTNDGIIIRFEANTKVDIASISDFTKRELNLNKGKILSSVSKLKKGSEYKISTMTAVASVRGTEFLTEYSGDKTIVAVGNGKVSVINSGTKKTEALDTGKSAVIANAEAAIKLRDINSIESLELSKISKTPMVENAEKKSVDELKNLYKDNFADSEEINSRIGEITGIPLTEIKGKFGRIDVISLYNGRVLQGAILSRGDTYKILTISGTIAVPAKDIKRTEIIK